MTPEQIKTLEDNLAIAIEALKFYANDSWDLGCGCCRVTHSEVFKKREEVAHDALVKISANNVATRYHNTLKNLAESEKKDLLESENESK
jgi:hypothetical protein